MFCPNCGSQLPNDSIFCQHCGEKLAVPVTNSINAQVQLDYESSINSLAQPTNYCIAPSNAQFAPFPDITDLIPLQQNTKKKKSAKLAIICSLSALLAVIIFFMGYNYINANNNIKAEKYVAAQKNLDNLIIAESIMPEKCELVEAGVLYENKEYIDALHALQKLENAPQELISKVETDIYFSGRTKYRNGELSEATTYFNEIYNFERSKDYLTLINIKNDISHVGYYYDVLYNLSGFEDSGLILLSTEENAVRFLKGTWKNVDEYYFSIVDYTVSYNLPSPEAYGYCSINNGIYTVGNNDVQYFKFTIVDKNVISVYCYEDSSTIFLFRQ